MQVFAQIRKVDEAKRLVFGRAAAEEVDKSGEIMDYASTKPHFAKWSADVAADSGGKSLGNLRAMHGKVAAGKLTQVEFDDDAKTIDVCAKVVDEAEWKKVLEGVYTGFSIGGSYVGNATVEKINGQDVKRYTASPNELSLVDRPCIPSAKFFQVQKVDGTTAEVPFQESADESVDVVGSPEEILALGKLMNDHKLTAGQTVERLTKALADDAAAAAAAVASAAAAPPAPVFADEAKLFNITDAARTRAAVAKLLRMEPAQLEKIDAAQQTALRTALLKAWQEQIDPKGTPPVDDVAKAALQKMVVTDLRKGLYSARSMVDAMVCLKGVMESEAYEAYREADGSPVPGMIKSVVSLCGQIVKAIVDEELRESPNEAAMVALAEQAGELAKLDADALPALVKALPQHAAAVRAALGIEPDIAPSDAAIQKLLDAALGPLQKRLDATQAELARIAAQPAATTVRMRAVSKGADLIEEHHTTAEVQKVVDARGAVNESATLIKQAHQQGGKPIFRIA